jgi:hypothetical protein
MEEGSSKMGRKEGAEERAFLVLPTINTAEKPGQEIDALTEAIERTALNAIADARGAKRRRDTVRTL